MSNIESEVNPYVEPQLIAGGALSITVEALLDPQEGTVLLVVRAYNVVTDKLIALWSSSPQPYEDHKNTLQQAWWEFRSLLDEHTGPF